ncbi:hypothetical protein K491DRAFT_717475 [Lophiostoma macrostomum CBS 122681]|uniref:Low temperature requirement A n=1 Tax=Lophiostoma macrostomum CBS 122681 TaxID=1314788 RepID=A0A6A6T227_9PLEO|nr:hypothetical protein K491DRAFT_717475 [Lophiostoma macrostomum CBS 122681]
MGFSIHGNKHREVDSEKHLKRLHKTIPFIESPLTGADHEQLVFSQRHEANTVELFFDLFFVANLATFTTYHSITDFQYLVAYVGFFGILWSCWFNVTLHDVRFARDSFYERICKTIQFIVFVGLALVGSAFNPSGKGANNTNLRILCYTLVISRSLLTIQYAIVLFFTFRAKYSKLYLPLALTMGMYAIAAVAFGAMIPAFVGEQPTNRRVYVVWYITMFVEGAVVIAISSFWKMLSFKKTHLMERMSLLTLIVIGEGAIGVTKTVSRMMGKGGLDVEGCFLIMCIIAMLVLLWALYFDNFPHGHYGTIRQQIWSLLHFPLQLSIVGVVEGSQQVALARYVMKNYVKIEKYLYTYCVQDQLDGDKLVTKLKDVIDYFKFDSKVETYNYGVNAYAIADLIGETKGICSAANVTQYTDDITSWPDEFYELTITMFDGVYTGLGMKIPVDKLEVENATGIAIDSWKLVYIYFWISFGVLITCSIIFLLLIRRHKADAFDFVSIIFRACVAAVSFSMLAIVWKNTLLYQLISSPGILPFALVLLILILFFDWLSATFCNWRLLKSGQPYAKEIEDEHHHHEAHGQAREHDPHHEPLATDYRKSVAYSTYSDTEPLTGGTSYHDPHADLQHRGSYAMTPLMSPPVMSPPIGSPPAVVPGYTPGGYMPVSHGQNYGA